MGTENPKRRPTGKPTQCDEALVSEILERVSNGESLTQICSDAHMPTRATLYNWRAQNDELSARYEMARQCGEEYYCDQMLKVADDMSLTDNARRIKIDVLKWTSSRIRGAILGNKKDDTAPVTQADLEMSLAEVINALKEGK